MVPRALAISFVLPVFDEEKNLAELHRGIVAEMKNQTDDYELIFVDDGSRDGSYGELCKLREADPRVRIVKLRANFGKSAAYSAGFDNARGEIVITMDTDLQDDPGDIPRFLEEIDSGIDVVSGWKHEGKGNLEKSLPSKFFNMVVRFATGITLHDFNCPFKAYRAQVLREIQVYGELHRYIPVLAQAKGFTISEIKVKNHPRRHGQSKYGWKRYIRGMLDLLTVIFITRFSRRPMHLLGVGGIVTCTVGLGAVTTFVIGHFLYKAGVLTDVGWNIHDRPAISLGILLMVVGIQFFTIGLLGELFVTRLAQKDDRAYSIERILEDRER